MKAYKTLLLAALSLSLSALSYAEDGYLVVLKSFTTPTLKQGQAIDKQFTQLKQQGFSPYIIKTDAYPPLKKGLWALVLGEFDKPTAADKQTQVKTWVKDAYIRKVQLPEARAIDEQFAAVETYFNHETDCFSVDKSLEAEGYGRDFCIGKQGYAVDIAYGDARAFVNINGEEFQGENWMGSDGFPFVVNDYPLTWIYRADKLRQPIAVSLVISTTDADGNDHNDRYLITIKGKNLTPVKKKFPVKGLDAVAAHLRGDAAETLDDNNTSSDDTASPTLQACLDDNQSSGWHRIVNENDCYIQDYQHQLGDIHQKITAAYQALLALPMHKGKQATGSLKQMDKAWQQYRDHKCQLFQALQLPFRGAQQSNCELETTKSYLEEQKKLLQEIQGTLADDKSFAEN